MMANGKLTDVMAKGSFGMEMVIPLLGVSTVIKDLAKDASSTMVEGTTKETG